MRIDRVVVNASPLICLSKSGLSDLLPSLFTEIIVPDKVYQEVTANKCHQGSNLNYTFYEESATEGHVPLFLEKGPLIFPPGCP